MFRTAPLLAIFLATLAGASAAASGLDVSQTPEIASASQPPSASWRPTAELGATASQIAPPERPALLAEEGGETEPDPEPETAPETANDAGLGYVIKITGVDGDLLEALEAVSSLEAKADAPPRGRAGLLRRVEADLEAFAAVLKSEGFYGYSLEETVDFGASPVSVEIAVTPGPAYRLEAFEIAYDDPSGEGLTTDPAALGVTVGEIARAAPVAAATPRLMRLLGEAGYPLAKAKKRSAVVDHGTQTMRVTLAVAEGPRVRFGKVVVTGADRVEPGYVARVAALPEGETFDVARVDQGRRRLFDTGLFEGLQIGWADAPDSDGKLDVTVEVTERDRRTISLGLNYSTTDGAGADIEWTHRNLFGEDEDLTLTLKVAQLEQSFRSELSAPHYGRLDQQVFVAGEVAREDTDGFEERRALVESGFSRKLSRHWSAGASGALSLLETIENGVSENNIVLAFPAFAAYDDTDNPFDPASGYKLDFRIEPAAITLETTDFLTTLTAGGSTYYDVAGDRRFIAAARAKAGVILGPALDRIPAGRRLFAGGGGSIRGFEFQSVSPLDAANEPDGGRSLAEFGVELRWRVTEDIGIVPFIDGGGAFEDPIPDFDDVLFAAGLGLRYYTPIGPLRLDVAFPLNGRDIDNLFEFYVSLGQAF